jgi:hypothetical protein
MEGKTGNAPLDTGLVDYTCRGWHLISAYTATLHAKAMFCLPGRPELRAFVLLFCREEEVQDARFLEPGKRHKNEFSLNGDGGALAVLRKVDHQRRRLLCTLFCIKCHSSGSFWDILIGFRTWAFKKNIYIYIK